MPESDLIEADHVRRKYSGATYYCLANESNKWYYMSHQQPGEVLLMKMFDSDENVKAKCTKSFLMTWHTFKLINF
jgi:hypothetical protein